MESHLFQKFPGFHSQCLYALTVIITFLLLLFRFCLKLKTLLTAASLERRSPPGAERKTSCMQLFLAFLLAVFLLCDWTVECIAMDTSSSGASWGNAVKFTSFVRRPTTAKTQKLTCKAKDVFICIFYFRHSMIFIVISKLSVLFPENVIKHQHAVNTFILKIMSGRS